uniref:Uncharacterized protein n=1 Tax=Sphaerodactylus townsendi TaxID=933632 RepID=A0ACB8FWY3_9SAUR
MMLAPPPPRPVTEAPLCSLESLFRRSQIPSRRLACTKKQTHYLYFKGGGREVEGYNRPNEQVGLGKAGKVQQRGTLNQHHKGFFRFRSTGKVLRSVDCRCKKRNEALTIKNVNTVDD